jgi:hypothetical protein
MNFFFPGLSIEPARPRVGHPAYQFGESTLANGFINVVRLTCEGGQNAFDAP